MAARSVGKLGVSAPVPCRVLYVDYSIGFGGATKSLGLTLRAMPQVTKFVLTCQDRHIIERWYPGIPVYGFRRLMNYRNVNRLDEWLRAHVSHGLHRLVRRGVVACDAAVSLAQCARIIALGRWLRVDLIHLNNGYSPVEAMVAAHLLHVPCLVHLRGFARLAPGIEARIASRVARAVPVSDAVAASVDEAVIPASRVTRIYDPVDVAAFDRAAGERQRIRDQWGIRLDEVLVGIFGRITRWKGQLEFVRALAAVIRTNHTVRGAIVGDRSDDTHAYFQEVRRAIAAEGLADRFSLMGYQENPEPYYHAMDIVVHASIEPEPFGMVVTEAMAAGKPIVAAAEGGPREVFSPEVDGLLVPPGDIGRMAESIAALASDAGLRARMGERGYAKAREVFSVEAAATQLSAVYDAVLSARS